eukprot:m.28286 g.28286  ORF g.28286 m.28286 type:complete len:144 (-) comp8798_c0_seq2:546-977(-)
MQQTNQMLVYQAMMQFCWLSSPDEESPSACCSRDLVLNGSTGSNVKVDQVAVRRTRRLVGGDGVADGVASRSGETTSNSDDGLGPIADSVALRRSTSRGGVRSSNNDASESALSRIPCGRCVRTRRSNQLPDALLEMDPVCEA